VANGVLHLLVAWLATHLVFGRTGRADQTGALQALAAEPFGGALLWLVTASFGAVVLWRAREAVWGYRYVREPRDRRHRRWFAASQVVVFGVLTALAARVAAGLPAGGGGQGVAAHLLRLPAGRVLVAAIGVGIVVVGVVMAYRGWRMAFTEDMDLTEAGPAVRALVHRTGQLGSVAKGIAVAMIGVLVATAGLSYQPARAEGLDAALRALAGRPFGAVPLLLIALGLASYGIFSFFDARYHRV